MDENTDATSRYVATVFFCVIVSCCIMAMVSKICSLLYDQYLRKYQKPIQDANANCGYRKLTDMHNYYEDNKIVTKEITNDETADDMNTEINVDTPGEILSDDLHVEIGESDHDDQLYEKPNTPTKDDDQIDIMHFYYMDYDEEIQEKDEDLYHEKQKWERCLMHALNGLLQKQRFTVKDMDNICKELAPNKLINPHKSVLNTGNYDANVLMMALGKVNIDVQWYDSRKANEFNLNDDTFWEFLEPNHQKLVGFIVNIPSNAALKMLKRRHWIAIKQIDGIWYNLDSKLKKPKLYETVNELTTYLVHNLSNNNAELMICRKENNNEHSQKKVAAIEW